MVFTMLCRKNMGCSHFIIGRDHAGVHDFYNPEENSRFLDSLGDLGIQPIIIEEIGYSTMQKKFIKNNNSKDIVKISGPDVRETLRNHQELPDWFMRVEVQDMLRDSIEQGVEVFHQ